MKSLLFTILFSILIALPVHSQMRGGGGGMGGGRMGGAQSQAQSMMKFDVEKMAGLAPYDEDKVLKKIKVKKEPKVSQVRALLRDYNKSIENIKLKHHQRIEETKNFVRTKRAEAQQNRDFEMMQVVRQEAQERLEPVREEVRAQQKVLNQKMKELLSKRQYKKWKKYLKKRKKSASSNSSNNSSMRGRGMRQGGGGGGMF